MHFQSSVIFFTISAIWRIAYSIPQPDELTNMLNNGQYAEFSQATRVAENIITPAVVDLNLRLLLNSQEFGDMMLLEEQTMMVEGSNVSHANGLLLGFWDKFVPYAIIPTNYTDEEINKIEENIRSWNYRFLGVIEFRKQVPEDNDYVAIFNGNGCFSHVSKLGGIQAISLNPHIELQPCLASGWIHHEMMHTIGVMHVNSRVDRDLYIKPNPDAIPFGIQRFVYDIVPDIATADPEKMYFEIEGPYDYESLMHLEQFLVPGQQDPAYFLLRTDLDPMEVGNPATRDLTYLDEVGVRNCYGNLK